MPYFARQRQPAGFVRQETGYAETRTGADNGNDTCFGKIPLRSANVTVSGYIETSDASTDAETIFRDSVVMDCRNFNS